MSGRRATARGTRPRKASGFMSCLPPCALPRPLGVGFVVGDGWCIADLGLVTDGSGEPMLRSRVIVYTSASTTEPGRCRSQPSPGPGRTADGATSRPKALAQAVRTSLRVGRQRSVRTGRRCAPVHRAAAPLCLGRRMAGVALACDRWMFHHPVQHRQLGASSSTAYVLNLRHCGEQIASPERLGAAARPR